MAESEPAIARRLYFSSTCGCNNNDDRIESKGSGGRTIGIRRTINTRRIFRTQKASRRRGTKRASKTSRTSRTRRF